MPKNKKKASDTSDSDSGPDDRGPAPKREKVQENCWELSKTRRAVFREFKGKWYMDIREYYNADGDMKPGKKGISLSMAEWERFVTQFDDMKEAVKKQSK